jgi:hypothetical protein
MNQRHQAAMLEPVLVTPPSPPNVLKEDILLSPSQPLAL